MNVIPKDIFTEPFKKFLKHEKLVKSYVTKMKVDQVMIGGKNMTITQDSFKLNEFAYSSLKTPCRICLNDSCKWRLNDPRAQRIKMFIRQNIPTSTFRERIILFNDVLDSKNWKYSQYIGHSLFTVPEAKRKYIRHLTDKFEFDKGFNN